MSKHEELMGTVARGWCHDKNAHKTVDVDLAMAIVDEIEKSSVLEIKNNG